jgi:hypothetical protein
VFKRQLSVDAVSFDDGGRDMTTEAQLSATHEGERLIKDWQECVRNYADRKKDAERAHAELLVIEKNLANWLLPEDAMTLEKYCVWYGDSMIAAYRLADGTLKVGVRKSGRKCPLRAVAPSQA